MENRATLLLYCQDRKGLVFVISRFLLQHGANILHADQHNDAELGLFFIRIQWSLAGFDLDQQGFDRVFAPLATGYGFTWQPDEATLHDQHGGDGESQALRNPEAEKDLSE